MNFYPVFLNIKNKKAVVVGGGKVAERKVLSLLRAGADVTVVSPSITERLRKVFSQKKISYLQRPYKKGDLRGAFLVIAATDSPKTNQRISRDSPALVNVVDVPELCNFIAPSVVARDPLLIAISTSGASPAFSSSVRKELEKLYGPDFSDYLKFVKKVREKAMKVVPQQGKRADFLKSLSSEETLKVLHKGGVEGVKERVLARLAKLGPAL